ncbi:hypothetical protein ACFVYG_32425 [Streptomyces sp. NPDC058256]|uniref:hypothetical protein n=1 Tax=Streptomyces sp. NPDC058256 TaxID=3346408 RepID=UPI0036E5ED9E
MTTHLHRPPTVTARTADHAPAPAAYTATAHLNTDSHGTRPYQPGHTLTQVTRADGSPLRLVFHASARITDHEAAADAAFTVGNYQGPDDNGQSWPADVRTVSVGDIVKVTGPDHWIIHLSVDSCGFSAVPEPTTLVNLTGTRATHRP